MFRNYLKVAVRNLSGNKVFSLINMLGLAVGMGVCLLIYQYIYFELSYDKFHTNAENTYRVTQTFTNREDLDTGVYTTYALGPRGKKTIPEIEAFVRIRPWEIEPVITNTENNEIHQEDKVWSVDKNFLQMFDFPLKFGDRKSALDDKHSVVITEQIATKYFGAANPLGKRLKVSLSITSGDFIVTGVLKKLPDNSHLQFDFLLPMAFLLESHTFYRENDSEGWGLADFVTYVTLNETGNTELVGKKFDELIATYADDESDASVFKWKTGLQPIADIHLKSGYARDPVSNNGNIQNVRFFSIVAIFILLMAWVNYINLSTARAIRRAKEVGIRKSVGAYRQQLMSQFLIESGLVNVMAAMLSIGIAFLLLPVLNNIIGKELQFNVFQDLEFWMWFAMVIMLGAILSGLYPAFVLSAFKPVSVLKSARVTPAKGFGLRKGLIVFQFLASVLLISGTYLVYKQITFMKNQDLGVEMKKILVLNGPRVFLEKLEEGATGVPKYRAFKNKAISHHSVFSVSATSSVPGRGYYYAEGFRKLGAPRDADKEASIVIADTDFTDAYDLEFLALTPFSKEVPRQGPGIINEEAVKVFGFGSAEKALHKKLVNNWGDTLEVLGVVRNVHWHSLKDAHSPILFFLNNDWGEYFSIQVDLSDIQETIAHIEDAYHSVFPNDPFHYFFLDDEFNSHYQTDLRFGNLFSAFSLLAIFIACLGLFALVSFSATLRIKEIGIRKVFGAGVTNLMILLSREYFVLLLVATGLAIPVIIFWGRAWLENYAYKTGMGIELFLIPALVLVIISVLTLSYRTYTSARANPVDSLKSE